jgi:peptidoglycan/xylan/chitin deacetylase (PgdA/CDA1 family)
MALREVLTILAGCTISVLGIAGCGDDARPKPEIEEITYTLTIAVTGDGTTDPPPGTHVYVAGTSVTTTATPQMNSAFMGWSGDASGTIPPATIVMDGDRTVTAQFSWGKSAASGLPNVPKRGVPRPSGNPGNLKVLDWAGLNGAVTYTLDDSQPSHIEHYAALQATGIKMTFYVNKETASGDLETWRQIAADGHEIGNHTVDHCHAPSSAISSLNGCLFGSAPPDAPAAATPESEIDDNSAWIKSAIGQSDVWTMATPFGDTNWIPYARPRFLLNRDVFQAMVAPNDNTDPAHLPCYMAGAMKDGGIDDSLTTFDQLIDTARSSDKWIIFLFHSILPTDAQWYGMVDISKITASTDHIKALGDMWADTLVSVGAYWRAQAVISSLTPASSPGVTTWTWTLPEHFPPGKYLRVTVDGGTLDQAGAPVPWDEHGYYEIALDKATLSLRP